MKAHVVCLALAACSAGKIPLKPRPAWSAQQPIAVTFEGASLTSSIDDDSVKSGTRSHLIQALLDLGFVVVDDKMPNVPIVKATAIERTSLSGEIRFGGLKVGTIFGDASNCTSAGWGIVADDNERCLANAFANELIQSPVLPKLYEYRASLAAQSAAPPPAALQPPPRSGPGCASNADCKAGRTCDMPTGTCVSR